MRSCRVHHGPMSAALAPFVLAAPLLQVEGDPVAVQDDLSATVRDLAPMGEAAAATIVSVEVRNLGSDAVEPLVFRISDPEGDTAPRLVARMPAPSRKRAGRLLAPRDRATFPIAVGAAPEDLADVVVEVVESCRWSPGSDAADLNVRARVVRVGRPRVEGEGDGAWSVARLENTSDHHIDVVLAAEYTNDGGGRCLTGVSLAPGEAIDHEMRSVPAHPFGGAALVPTIEVARLEVVDWSVRTDPGGDAARALMGPVWNSWSCIPPEKTPLHVRFSVEVEHLFEDEPTPEGLDEQTEGQLWVRADGSVQFATREGAPLLGREGGGARGAVRSALAWILREPFERAVRGWELELLRPGSRPEVRLSGEPWSFGRDVADLRLEGGAIVAAATRGQLDERADEWEVTRGDDGWRLDETRRDLGGDRTLTSTAEYTVVDGVEVLAAMEIHEDDAYVIVEDEFVRAPRRTRIRFEGWRFGVEPPPAPGPPTGALAERLEEAWNGFYRYPDPRVELQGDYEVDVRGRDGLWRGHSSIEGSFSLRHFDGGGWRHRTVTCDSRNVEEADVDILVNAVQDRIGMWSGRVPCWRADFSETFAGASLSEGEESHWILVHDHPTIEGVRVDHGRIEAIREGSLTTFRWKSPRGRPPLPVRIEREGNGQVELDWDEIAPGWWFPKRVRFTEIFGPNWGPETLEMDVQWVGPLDQR